MSKREWYDATPRCEICEFSYCSDFEWVCRKNPPVAVQFGNRISSVFAETHRESWCGAYEHDRAKAMVLQNEIEARNKANGHA